MKQVMKFNLWGNTVGVYFREVTDSFLVFQMIGRKKFFIDEVDGTTEAANIAMNFCYENAC